MIRNYQNLCRLLLWGSQCPSVGITFKRTMASSDCENFVRDGKKIIGAAVNYHDFLKKNNVPAPENPVMFLKPTSSYIVEGQDIIIPKVFTRVAHEVELGVIINRKCKDVSKQDAMSYVGGYCLALDMTAQCELGVARPKGLPWCMGKGFDTSTPVSRFIRLREIKDPHNLRLWLKVNNETRQDGNTSDLIFNVPELIEYTSKYMTLEPNDLILTGTPVGANPVSAGDVIECGLGDVVSMKFNVKGA
ncbi:acylpyruvase FAHD1, mitochondrial isoform X2 [Hermetia illucens]|nr:acylpyruvase FAHD1, mitochondrial isoform X2 [Hermetia illucens]XP_037922072.1 acylpyruvase FAHD1, mitochondrial isoform X2 [Hermetia illucens]